MDPIARIEEVLKDPRVTPEDRAELEQHRDRLRAESSHAAPEHPEDGFAAFMAQSFDNARAEGQLQEDKRNMRRGWMENERSEMRDRDPTAAVIRYGSRPRFGDPGLGDQGSPIEYFPGDPDTVNQMAALGDEEAQEIATHRDALATGLGSQVSLLSGMLSGGGGLLRSLAGIAGAEFAGRAIEQGASGKPILKEAASAANPLTNPIPYALAGLGGLGGIYGRKMRNTGIMGVDPVDLKRAEDAGYKTSVTAGVAPSPGSLPHRIERLGTRKGHSPSEVAQLVAGSVGKEAVRDARRYDNSVLSQISNIKRNAPSFAEKTRISAEPVQDELLRLIDTLAIESSSTPIPGREAAVKRLENAWYSISQNGGTITPQDLIAIQDSVDDMARMGQQQIGSKPTELVALGAKLRDMRPEFGQEFARELEKMEGLVESSKGAKQALGLNAGVIPDDSTATALGRRIATSGRGHNVQQGLDIDAATAQIGLDPRRVRLSRGMAAAQSLRGDVAGKLTVHPGTPAAGPMPRLNLFSGGPGVALRADPIAKLAAARLTPPVAIGIGEAADIFSYTAPARDELAPKNAPPGLVRRWMDVAENVASNPERLLAPPASPPANPYAEEPLP